MSRVLKTQHFKRRQKRTRSNIHGTATRPRLSVYKSNRACFAQIIDDDAGVTLVSMHSRSASQKGKPRERAFDLGKSLGSEAKKKGIAQVIFDKSGYRYHGQVQAIADGAREGGLDF